MIRKLAALIGLAIAALLVVVAVNTYRIGTSTNTAAHRVDVPIEVDRAAERLAEAIRIRTISTDVSAPAAEAEFRALHELLAARFPATHAKLQREVVNEASLLFTWPGRNAALAPVLLTGHMDVVPVESGTEDDWTHPPFAGVVADGFVWGRGAIDMKGSIMSIMEAVELLARRNAQPERTIHLAFGHDEELGGMKGAAAIAAILASRGVRLDFVLDEGLVVTHGIIPGVARPVALIGIAEKGQVTIELVARDTGGHASMAPSPGAVGRIGRALSRLSENPMTATLSGPAGAMLDGIAPDSALAMRVALANRSLFEPAILWALAGAPSTNALIRTTGAITMVNGGVKSNVVPQEARAVIDFRILPGDTVASVKSHVTHAIDDPAIELRNFDSDVREPSPVSSTTAASYALLVRAANAAFPDAAVAPSLVLAVTDSRHYEKLAVNTYRFQPLRMDSEDLTRVHGTNERVAVPNYAEAIRFYFEVLRGAAFAP